MDNDGLKKTGAILSAAVAILAFLSVPVMYLMVGAPLWLVAGTFLILIVIAVLMMYYTMERIQEIEGGLEDDLDDY